MPDTRPAPVVLLHGCGGTAAATFGKTGMLDALQRAGRTPVVIDLPGHGHGQISHDPTDYEDLAGRLADHLPEGRFDGVGYSLGAKLLLELAIRMPDRIGRLALGGVGDNVFAPEAVAEAAAKALETGLQTDTPAPVLAFLRSWDPQSNDALAVAAVLRRPPNPVFTEGRLAAIRAAVLLVNGDSDPACRISTRLAACLTDVRRRTLPGIGHFELPREAAFIQAAAEFLAVPAGQGH